MGVSSSLVDPSDNLTEPGMIRPSAAPDTGLQTTSTVTGPDALVLSVADLPQGRPVGDHERLTEEGADAVVGPQQCLDPFSQLRFGRALPAQDGGAVVGIMVLDGRPEQGLDPFRIERHGGSPRLGS